MYVYKPHYLLGLPFCCGPFTEGVPIIELECYHTDNNTIAFLNLYQLSVAVLAPPIVTSQYTYCLEQRVCQTVALMVRDVCVALSMVGMKQL